MKIKNIFQSKWYSLVVTILLVISAVYSLSMTNIYKWSVISSKAVPRVELSAGLRWDGGNLQGKTTGFVAFMNQKDQPKDLTQYVTIDASKGIPLTNQQLLTAENIIAYNNLAPRSLGLDNLHIKSSNDLSVTLTDDNSNLYEVDTTGKITLQDSTGDLTYLITDQSKFRDFMFNWLK